MNTCPHCGALNRPTAKFCNTCGKPVSMPEESVTTPEAAASQESPNVPVPDIPAPSQVETPPEIPDSPPVAVNDIDADNAPSVSEQTATMGTQDSTDDAAPISEQTVGMETQNGADNAADSTTQAQPYAESTAPASDESADAPIAAANENTTAAEPAAQDSAITDSSMTDTLAAALPTALAIGTVLQERFTILEIVSQAGDVITYRARDAWRCPTCDFVNEADAVFCSNCGRELTERGTTLLVERENSAELSPPPDFVEDSRAFQIQPDVSATAAPPPTEPRVRLQFVLASDVGIVRGSAREPNEDSAFGLALSAVHESQPHPTLGLFIIADGVGGSEAGELASKKAIHVLSTVLLQSVVAPVLQGESLGDDAVRGKIRAAILDANLQVMQLAAEKQNDMGTTVTLAVILDTRAYIANVGDSRTYLVRDAKLTPITQDHSLVASLVSANLIASAEVYTHPQRNIILRSLGANAELEVDVFPLDGGTLELQAGDRLLLCSDGLWEMVRDFDLESILLREWDLNKAAASMIVAANEGGGEDNVSLALVSVLP